MNFRVPIKEMYPWILCEVVTDPLWPTEYTLEAPGGSLILCITYDITQALTGLSFVTRCDHFLCRA